MARATDPTHDPDRGVLERVAGGDVESFGILVERHQARLSQLCMRLLGDAEEAREVTQDTFLKALRKADRFEPRAQVYTWLYRIATNACLNRLRRRRLVRFLPFADLARDDDREAESAAFDPVDDGPDAEDQLRARRRWQRTRAHIDRLPATQRAVLVLAKFEGLSYRQIADTLGITQSAVESRLHRAMKTLIAADTEKITNPPQEMPR